MASFQLKAQKREKFGSLEARRIKKSGKIPAIVLSKKENLNISIDSKEFEVEFKKGNIQSRVIEIEVDGKKVQSIAKDINLDPVTDRVVHVDFINVGEGEKVRAWPKVEIINRDKSPGIKKGGFLNIRLRKAEVICDETAKIPDTIVIDAEKLKVGDKIRKDDISLEAGVKFATNRNFLFVSITGRGKMSEDATADGAAEGAEGSTEGEDTAGAEAAADK